MEPTGQIKPQSARSLSFPDQLEDRRKAGFNLITGRHRRVLALMVCCLPATFGVAQSSFESDLELLSKKPTLEIAQAPPPADDTVPDVPADTAPAATDDSEFVFAGDLARTLRRIDPDAKVDWDGKKLLIHVNDQEFAIFPTGEDMVVNGDVQTGLPPLKIRNGEIYVPQQAVSSIGQVLENKLAPAEPTTTPAPEVTTATATVTPAISPTPGASILPDGAPATTTPTPAVEAVPILPDVTPSPAAAATPTPAATPAATPAVTPQTSVATPFPKATPTPTPRPTPTPTPTPAPSPTPKDGASASTRNTVLSAESFKAALQDKISVSTRDIAIYNMTQLNEMAANRNVKKIIIHAEEGGLEREDDYGKETARLSMELAQRVKVQLQDAGFEVEMTRNSAAAVTVGEALQTITRSKAQVLLVISVGYSTSFQDLGGYRLFFMNDSVDYNTLRDRTFDASEAVPSEMNYKPFQDISKVLASSLRNSVQGVLDRDPVGMNPAPLYFVRRAPMAATAIVTGYLSNPADAKRLTDPAQQDAMAKALVEGIQKYAEQISQGKTKPAGDL